MSRSLSPEMEKALNQVNGIRSSARATIYKSRIYFDSFLSSAGSPEYAQDAGILDKPIPQVSFVDEYGDLYTIYVSPEGKIEFSKSSSVYVTSVLNSSSPLMSPIWHRPGVSLPNLYRIDQSGNLICDTLNLEAMHLSTYDLELECITSETIIESIGSTVCSICGISETEFVLFKIDDGGVGIVDYSYESGSWIKRTYPYRFIFPIKVMDENSETDPYMLQYSTAIRRDDGLWIYFSYPTGEVKGIHLDIDNNWEDMFQAIPADLSVFKIVNSFLDSKQRIHISGMYQRVDSTGFYSSDTIWNLLSYSDDGKVFSLDKNTLFSLMGYRFSAIPIGDEIYFCDANRYSRVQQGYLSIYENAESLVLRKEIISCQGQVDSGYVINLVSNSLLFHPLLIEGNILKLEIGINTIASPGTFDFIRWDTCVISKITTNLRDAVQGISITAITEGLYKIQKFSYPYYLEIDGKQSEYDPMSDFSNMYKAPYSGGIREPFSVDLWGNTDLYAGGGLPPMDHAANVDKIIMSGDLKDVLYLSDYPVISEDTLPLTFKIYGWSRIGIPNAGSSPTIDETPYTNPNDSFIAVLKIQHASTTSTDPTTGIITTIDGEVETITLSATDAIDGVSYPPQYWKEGNDRLASGKYPVEYSIDSSKLALGDMIIEVGILVRSTSPTCFYLERIDIPELAMYIDPTSLTSSSNSVESLTDYTPFILKRAWTFDTDLDGWQNVSTEITSAATGSTNVPDALIWSDHMMAMNFNFDSGTNYYWCTSLINVSNLGVVVTANTAIKYDSSLTNTTHWWGGWTERKIQVKFTDGTNYTFDLSSGTGISVPIPSAYIGKTILALYFGCQVVGTYTSLTTIDNIEITENGDAPTLADETQYLNVIDKKGIQINNYGVPVIYFSTMPYSAFNFEASCKIKISGNYSYGGLVGIAADGKNYICGRYKVGQLQIIKVRDGLTTILATEDYTSQEDYLNLMFTHYNGEFSLRVKQSGKWGDPLLTYRWKKDDGEIATDIDLFAVGTYSIVDVPKFRICSFDASVCSDLCVLPGYTMSSLDGFPSTGLVVIDGTIYTYTGKSSLTMNPKGPYQVRALFSYGSYNDPIDGEFYSGVSIEFTMFEWKYNPDHYADYTGYVAMSNQGYGWPIIKSEFKPWITTDGQLVELLNRSRHFCQSLDARSIISCSDKMYISHGLSGVVLNPGQDTNYHSEGTYCFLYDANANIELTDFYASSHEDDATVKDMVSKICKMAGVHPKFPGDTIYPTLTLPSGNEVLL